MVKEKNISPPNEEVSELETKTLGEVSVEDKAKQDDYNKRMDGFMKGFEKLQKRWDIKLLQVPARIIYYDTKI